MWHCEIVVHGYLMTSSSCGTRIEVFASSPDGLLICIQVSDIFSEEMLHGLEATVESRHLRLHSVSNLLPREGSEERKKSYSQLRRTYILPNYHIIEPQT